MWVKIPLCTLTIALISTKVNFLAHMKYNPYTNIAANPVLCIEIPCLYIIPTFCHLSEKRAKQNFTFVIKLGHEDLEIQKNLS